MKNKFIRRFLIQFLTLFISRNCQYGYEEQQAVLNCLEVLSPVVDEYEEYNKRNPNHGKPIIE